MSKFKFSTEEREIIVRPATKVSVLDTGSKNFAGEDQLCRSPSFPCHTRRIVMTPSCMR